MTSKVFKWFLALQLVLLLTLPAVFAEEGKGAPPIDLAPNAASAALIDADTGTVIFEKNKDAKLPRPASPKL
ncbi:hypothetical protein LJK88_30835 [Paenibacillus sp. P26]|nr:hypothetical protein LJK88_30835 [Paenibacillus sp. P26]UUZ94359.1 hypothetical protein LJK87_07230 [Paenibacillus sp. P25]